MWMLLKDMCQERSDRVCVKNGLENNKFNLHKYCSNDPGHQNIIIPWASLRGRGAIEHPPVKDEFLIFNKVLTQWSIFKAFFVTLWGPYNLRAWSKIPQLPLSPFGWGTCLDTDFQIMYYVHFFTVILCSQDPNNDPLVIRYLNYK